MKAAVIETPNGDFQLKRPQSLKVKSGDKFV